VLCPEGSLSRYHLALQPAEVVEINNENVIFIYLNISFRRPFVNRFALCYRTVVCPVLSLTLVYWQDVWMIKMQFAMEVGLGLGHIVLDGDRALRPKMGTAPNFWPISVGAKQLDGSRRHLVGR